MSAKKVERDGGMGGLWGCEARAMDVAGRMVTVWAGALPTEDRDAAFTALVERQGRVMFRVAMAVLRLEDEAEEAVQEAFLRMFRGSGWRRPTDEKAYAVKVVWRVAVGMAKQRARRRTDVDVQEMELEGGGERVDAGIGREQEARRLRRLMEALPEELRQSLLLCAVEELSSREVGAMMGVPEGTVRTRVMRAKAELRRRWLAMDGRKGGTR